MANPWPHIVCGVLFLFSRGLIGFWPKLWKTKLSTLWPYGYSLAPHSLWSFVFFCFLFSGGFLVFDQKLQKPGEKRQLSTLWPYGYPLAPHSLFFVFSRLFWFVTKSCKNLEKQKTKKNIKIAHPNSLPLLPPWALQFCILFVFLRKTKGLPFMPPEPLTCIECTLLVQASLSWKHICTLIRTDTIQLYTCHGYAY